MSSPPPPAARRYDLDWIRVGAFMLLILYHVGMFYVPWDWHVKSPQPVEALEPIMMLTNPWRLTLLFLVSGCATRFIADRFATDGGSGALRLAGSRTLRLLPPLLFGMFVVVPPQSYYQVVEAVQRLAPQADAYHNTYVVNFWVKYATASGHWCDAEGCLTTPTWNHLWFVAYLLVYSLILAAGLMVAGKPLRRLGEAMARGLDGWGLLLWPIAFLAVLRFTLAPLFEINHALVGDWYNHAFSFAAFLFGFLMAKSEPLKAAFIRLRWPALVLALASWSAWAAYAWIYRADDAMPAEVLRLVMRVVYATDQWTFIAAILGFGALHLNRDSRLLRYLTVGVFPFYIAHQTITVVAGHHLARLGLPVGLEAPLLVGITALGCVLTYEVARRIGWFGLLLGVKPKALARPAQAAKRPPLAA